MAREISSNGFKYIRKDVHDFVVLSNKRGNKSAIDLTKKMTHQALIVLAFWQKNFMLIKNDMKSESSARNDEFIEDQTLSEIDPLVVQTENNYIVIWYFCI